MCTGKVICSFILKEGFIYWRQKTALLETSIPGKAECISTATARGFCCSSQPPQCGAGFLQQHSIRIMEEEEKRHCTQPEVSHPAARSWRQLALCKHHDLHRKGVWFNIYTSVIYDYFKPSVTEGFPAQGTVCLMSLCSNGAGAACCPSRDTEQQLFLIQTEPHRALPSAAPNIPKGHYIGLPDPRFSILTPSCFLWLVWLGLFADYTRLCYRLGLSESVSTLRVDDLSSHNAVCWWYQTINGVTITYQSLPCCSCTCFQEEKAVMFIFQHVNKHITTSWHFQRTEYNKHLTLTWLGVRRQNTIKEFQCSESISAWTANCFR